MRMIGRGLMQIKKSLPEVENDCDIYRQSQVKIPDIKTFKVEIVVYNILGNRRIPDQSTEPYP